MPIRVEMMSESIFLSQYHNCVYYRQHFFSYLDLHL